MSRLKKGNTVTGIVKGGTLILLVFCLFTGIASVTASSSFISVIKEMFGGSSGNLITGRLTSGTTGLSITVTNLPPNVTDVPEVPEQSITESGATAVILYFTASDVDGVSNLNDSSATINLTTTDDSTVILNDTCEVVADLDSTSANYTCTLYFQYFDVSGNWTIEPSIKDNSGAMASNNSVNVSLAPTLAIQITPSSLSFASIAPGADNATATDDPILVNNTGNQNVTSGNVQVQAFSLIGGDDATKNIPAANFTVGNVTGGENSECVATAMVNGTATAIPSTFVPRGNNSVGVNPENGIEELYVCLVDAPTVDDLPSQTYSATGASAWVVSVS